MPSSVCPEVRTASPAIPIFRRKVRDSGDGKDDIVLRADRRIGPLLQDHPLHRGDAAELDVEDDESDSKVLQLLNQVAWSG